MEFMDDEKEGFKILKKRITRDRGFNCNSYKESTLKRRIRSRMLANNIDSYIDYANFLIGNDEEYRKLIDALTVNVTSFFRDPETFDEIKNVVLPELVNRKNIEGRRIIRIWSAGCSSGEEPYSIAILLYEYLGNNIDRFIISIRSTDIDERSLEEAKLGIYDKDSIEKLKSEYLNKYFEEIDGKYRIKNKIKKLVRFEKHDLVSGRMQKYFDILFCRNVLIYFSRETQKDIFEKLYDA